MKTLLTVSKGEHFAARLLRTMAVLLIGFGLGGALWIATIPAAEAQGRTPQQMLQAKLPANTQLTKANKGQLVSAVAAAVQDSPGNIGQFVRLAAQVRKGDVVDIVTAAIRGLGTDPDCVLVVRAVEGGIEANGKQAAAIVEAALGLASKCGGEIQRVSAANSADSRATGRGDTDSQTSDGDEDTGNFGNNAGNQNPAPGSVGGGGGSQSGRCQVCHRDGQGRRRTLTVSCNAVPAHLAHGDTEGPCAVTPTQNP